MVARSLWNPEVLGSNPILGFNFFSYLSLQLHLFFWNILFSFFLLINLLQKTILKNISYIHSTLNSQKCKKDWKKLGSHRDSNPALPIQSQLCLPHNQRFSKTAWKIKILKKKCWPGVLKSKFQVNFDNVSPETK